MQTWRREGRILNIVLDIPYVDVADASMERLEHPSAKV